MKRLKSWPARIDKWLSVSVRRALLNEHLESLEFDFGYTVLEIGAGRKGRRGDYVPPVDKALTWLQLDLKSQAHPHLCGDLQRLPFPQAAFDSILCLEVIEYLDDPYQGFQELNRALHPGGILVLAAPFFHRADSEHDYWRFTEPGLRALMAQAGFEITVFLAQGAALATAVNTLKFALHQLKRGRMFWGTLFRPVLNVLWRYDQALARRLPVLASFSTGYLVLARTTGDGPEAA